MKNNTWRRLLAALIVCMMMVSGLNMLFANAEETVTGEEPVAADNVEVPAEEEPAGDEEPAGEEPAANEPVAEEPAAEEPATEEPVAEEPVVEEPVVEEPAVEDPVVEEPVVEEPVVEEPVVEEPVVEEPVVEEPVVEEPVVEEPVVEEPVVEEPVVEEPVVEEPVVEEPVVEEPVVEEPVVEEPVVEEPVVEEPVVEEPVVEEPVVEEPVAEETVAEEPVAEEPVVEEPVVEEPAVEEPAVEEPVVEEPVVEEPVAFTGILGRLIMSEEPYTEGDFIKISADVQDANMAYAINWERKELNKEDAVWKAIPNVEEGNLLMLEATFAAAEYTYRACLTAEDGTVQYSNEVIFTVVPAVEEPVVVNQAPAAKEEETMEFEDYETALGGFDYTFERDENGELVLDEKGNPVAVLEEDDEIPVTFLRDEEGNLILDEDGDPVVTQTVPTDAQMINTIVDQLNPDRTIDVYYSWNNEKPSIGGDVTFVAVLYGYDNLEYTVQWQQSKNDVDWTDVASANEVRHVETITRENYKDFWRVQVIITGVKE